MKTLFISILLFMQTSLFSYAQGAHQLTQQQAWEIVKDSILSSNLKDVDVYVSNKTLDNGTVIPTIMGEEQSPEFVSWLFFIDDEPNQNWEHTCRYVFVNVHDGSILVKSRKRPPLFDSFSIISRKQMIKSKSQALYDLGKYKVLNQSSVSFPAIYDYAVIISGGANKEINHERYWNDCAAIYSTLVNVYNYPKDHIYVLMADGTNPAADRKRINGSFDSSPLDLDGDGVNDIKYSATASNISKVFNELGAKLTSKDNLFIYTTDHGGQISGNQVYLCLWNNATMTDEAFAKEVKKVKAGKIAVCMEQCNSGGFIDNLAGTNRIIATACKYNETSKAMGNLIYDEFVYYWTAAVTGKTPSGTAVNADTNNDGYVSMEEAFNFAKAKDTKSETPQYSSTPSSLGSKHYLHKSYQLTIAGDDVVCDSSFFYVKDLPQGYNVSWSYSSPYSTFKPNYPSSNTCMIKTKNYLYRGILTATVKKNGATIGTAKKYVTTNGSSYYCKYSQEACAYYGVSHPQIVEKNLNTGVANFVHQGCRVKLSSDIFKYMDVTHTGVTPASWVVENNGNIYFELPLNSGGIPFYVIAGGEGSCKQYKYLFFSVSSNGNISASHSLKISSTGSNTKDISIVEDTDNAIDQSQLVSDVKDMQWSIDIYNASNGDHKVSSRMVDACYQLNTTYWERGTYIIRVSSGEDVMVKKLSIQ